jgi:Cu(I)/Ag(I) efflux system membrane protein CusA/SilA
MPIKARIDMLSTGIRTPIGVKVFGPDLEVITKINDELERTLRTLPHTRSVYAERELGGFFLDVTPDREAIARYGLSVRDVLDVVESTIGGMDVATTYEGRERFKINVRYPRELRDNLDALRNVLVPIAPMSPRALPASPPPGAEPMEPAAPASGMTGMGAKSPTGDEMPSDGMSARTATTPAASAGAAFVPLGQLAKIQPVMGPPMIKSEMGQITGWTYVDIDSTDVGGYVTQAKEKVDHDVKLPPGYTVKWTGQYELLERVRSRLTFVLPLTILIVFGILYINFRGAAQALIVMASVPFAAVGAIWTLWIAGFNTSIAVWVGMIALLGVAAETASVMVVYLDEAWVAGRAKGTINTVPELASAALDAGAKRVRPLLMTVMTNVFGLLPILLDTGVGSDVAKRIAAPMWGGLMSLTILTLLVIPAIYVVWRSFHLGPPKNPTGKLGESP